MLRRSRSIAPADLITSSPAPGRGPTELLITCVCKAAFKLTQFDYAGALTVVMFSLFVCLALIANLLAGGDAGQGRHRGLRAIIDANPCPPH